MRSDHWTWIDRTNTTKWRDTIAIEMKRKRREKANEMSEKCNRTNANWHKWESPLKMNTFFIPSFDVHTCVCVCVVSCPNNWNECIDRWIAHGCYSITFHLCIQKYYIGFNAKQFSQYYSIVNRFKVHSKKCVLLLLFFPTSSLQQWNDLQLFVVRVFSGHFGANDPKRIAQIALRRKRRETSRKRRIFIVFENAFEMIRGNSLVRKKNNVKVRARLIC